MLLLLLLIVRRHLNLINLNSLNINMEKRIRMIKEMVKEEEISMKKPFQVGGNTERGGRCPGGRKMG